MGRSDGANAVVVNAVVIALTFVTATCARRPTGRDQLDHLATRVTVFERECTAGRADACTKLGMAYELNSSIPRPPNVDVVELYRRGCDGNDPQGCANLGARYQLGNGVAKNAVRAAALDQRSCDAGAALGCDLLAVLYLTGDGVAKDATKAASLLEAACTGNDEGSLASVATIC